VRARTWVWASIVYFAVWNVAMGPIFLLGPFVAEESLGGASSWGLIVSASGLGALVGGVLALRIRPRRPLVAGSLAISLVALEAAFLARPFPTVFVAVTEAVGLAGVAVANAFWFTALQQRIPREAISRVSAYDWLGSTAFKPLGYALVGPLAATLGASGTLLLAALVLGLSSVIAASLPSVRAVRCD
jgi:hypothetical protein